MKENLLKFFTRYSLIAVFVCIAVFPFKSAHAAMDATVTLYPTRAIVTINSITPVPEGNYNLTLSSGAIQNNLGLFGGTQSITAGTAFPIEKTFPTNNQLAVGVTYYVRLYIDNAGTTHLIYPPFAQDPLPVVVAQDPNPVVNPNNNNQTNTNTNTNNQNTGTTTTNTAAPGMGNNGLVPCGNPGQQACGFTHLLQLFSNIINFIFILVVPIAAAMFVYFGFRYIVSRDNAQLRSALKGYFANLIIGILIVLVAWLAVATLLRALGVPDAYVLLKL